MIEPMVTVALSQLSCWLFFSVPLTSFDLDLGSHPGQQIEVNSHCGSALSGKTLDTAFCVADLRLVVISKSHFLSLRSLNR